MSKEIVSDLFKSYLIVAITAIEYRDIHFGERARQMMQPLNEVNIPTYGGQKDHYPLLDLARSEHVV
jgi:hypothetical protein